MEDADPRAFVLRLLNVVNGKGSTIRSSILRVGASAHDVLRLTLQDRRLRAVSRVALAQREELGCEGGQAHPYFSTLAHGMDRHELSLSDVEGFLVATRSFDFQARDLRCLAIKRALLPWDRASVLSSLIKVCSRIDPSIFIDLRRLLIVCVEVNVGVHANGARFLEEDRDRQHSINDDRHRLLSRVIVRVVIRLIATFAFAATRCVSVVSSVFGVRSARRANLINL